MSTGRRSAAVDGGRREKARRGTHGGAHADGLLQLLHLGADQLLHGFKPAQLGRVVFRQLARARQIRIERGLGLDKGFEIAVRTSQQMQLQLSQMADQKASMLMGATFLAFKFPEVKKK